MENGTPAQKPGPLHDHPRKITTFLQYSRTINHSPAKKLAENTCFLKSGIIGMHHAFNKSLANGHRALIANINIYLGG